MNFYLFIKTLQVDSSMCALFEGKKNIWGEQTCSKEFIISQLICKINILFVSKPLNLVSILYIKNSIVTNLVGPSLARLKFKYV